MRLRHIKGAEEEIAESPYVVQEPKELKGKWHEFFGNNNPIRIEVGMGKGKFIMELAEKPVIASHSNSRQLCGHARNLTDDSDFTMMSNKEFEVLFHADDRNDEIEFRLLFTPLAQAQMISLLNDTQEGYGDDFSFVKREKINMLSPEHLQNDDLDVDPEQFRDYSFDNVKAYFIKRSNAFFKSFYLLIKIISV